MIIEAILICALSEPPWGFIDPLSVEAKIETIKKLEEFTHRYPDYEWLFVKKDDTKEQPTWRPTPWVFMGHRLYARKRSA